MLHHLEVTLATASLSRVLITNYYVDPSSRSYCARTEIDIAQNEDEQKV